MKKNAGRKRSGKKNPENLDDALFGDYHGDAIWLVMETRSRMNKIPECPDPHEEDDRLYWRDLVGGMIVDSIMQGDDAAVQLFDGITKLLKDKCVDEKGDWKKPVDAEWTEAALIVMRQHDDRPERSEWHLPPMTQDEFDKQRTETNPKVGDPRRTGTRMARVLRAKIIPGKKGRPKESDRSTN